MQVPRWPPEEVRIAGRQPWNGFDIETLYC